MKTCVSTTAALALLALTAGHADAAVKYKACTEGDRQSVFGGLTNELQSCSKSSDYDITSTTLPTSDQRQSICKCTDLVKRIGDLRLPRCNLVLDGSALSFKDAVASIFTACSIAEPQEVPETPAPAGSSTNSSGSADATPTPSSSEVSLSGSGSSEAGKPASSSSSSSSSTAGSELDIETQKVKKPKTKPASEDLEIQGEADLPTPTPSPTPKSASGTISAVTSVGVALVTIAAYAMA